MVEGSAAERRWDAPGAGRALRRVWWETSPALERPREVVPALRRRLGRLALAFKQILFSSLL